MSISDRKSYRPIQVVRKEIGLLFKLKETERLWHIPALASLCTGLPLLIGYYFGRLDFGSLSCIGGLVILYLPSTKIEHRMLTLALCSFGFIISFAIGAGFSFNPVLSAITLGMFAFGVSWLTNYFNLPPPGNFFFIFIASLASCMRFDLYTIPARTGLVAMGSMLACILAFCYSLYASVRIPLKPHVARTPKKKYSNFSESVITGVFISLSLAVGLFFKFEYPYWIPVSCLAIMQGLNAVHVGQRSFHRILGTFIGMFFSGFLLRLGLTPLLICIVILVFQFVVEMLVVRHYTLAVIFITPMTMLLAEIGNGTVLDPKELIWARFSDILIGSLFGLLGGYLLHNRQLHHNAELLLRHAKISRLRKRP